VNPRAAAIELPSAVGVLVAIRGKQAQPGGTGSGSSRVPAAPASSGADVSQCQFTAVALAVPSARRNEFRGHRLPSGFV
jgi:hypothetical protein